MAANSMVTIRFARAGTVPPVYIAGTMTSPPWSPMEMHPIEADADEGSGSPAFELKFEGISSGKHHYKFRLAEEDLWTVDDNATKIVDDEGNENNLLMIEGDEDSTTSEQADNQDVERDDTLAVERDSSMSPAESIVKVEKDLSVEPHMEPADETTDVPEAVSEMPAKEHDETVEEHDGSATSPEEAIAGPAELVETQEATLSLTESPVLALDELSSEADQVIEDSAVDDAISDDPLTAVDLVSDEPVVLVTGSEDQLSELKTEVQELPVESLEELFEQPVNDISVLQEEPEILVHSEEVRSDESLDMVDITERVVAVADDIAPGTHPELEEEAEKVLTVSEATIVSHADPDPESEAQQEQEKTISLANADEDLGQVALEVEEEPVAVTQEEDQIVLDTASEHMLVAPPTTPARVSSTRASIVNDSEDDAKISTPEVASTSDVLQSEIEERPVPIKAISDSNIPVVSTKFMLPLTKATITRLPSKMKIVSYSSDAQGDSGWHTTSVKDKLVPISGLRLDTIITDPKEAMGKRIAPQHKAPGHKRSRTQAAIAKVILEHTLLPLVRHFQGWLEADARPT